MIAGMNTSTIRVGIVAAAVAVTAIATAAVTATVLSGGDDTLTQDQVAALLAASPSGATPTSTSTSTPGGSSTTEDNQPEVWSGPPGTITVRCVGNTATLLSWSPNPGYRSDDPVTGPAAEVSVRFENDSNDADYKVTATCTDGVANVVLGPDDHSGRGRGRGGDD